MAAKLERSSGGLVAMQESLLKRYDQDPVIITSCAPIDERNVRPAPGRNLYRATPYCFRLPAYVAPGPTQLARPLRAPVNHDLDRDNRRDACIGMGQARGRTGINAHKHGSTTIDVAMA